MLPKISVIMPAYNAEKYIAESIDSILRQTFGDFELIILNDCSQDSTEEVILSYGDSRIVYLKNEENMGVARTLNRGLSVARGMYIARMDADDISLPERFEKQVQYLDTHKDVVVLGVALERFGAGVPSQIRCFSTDCHQMKTDMFFACGLAHPGVMMRREEILQLGGYDTEYNGLEDYELWCRVCKQYGVTALPEVLLRYRIHGEQVTKNPSPAYQKRMRALKARLLDDLHLPTEGDLAESFYTYSMGKMPEDPRDIIIFCRFLESVIDANQNINCYNPAILSYTFRPVVLNATEKLPLGQALAVCGNTKLIKRTDILICRMKRSIKRLLGR